MRDHLISAETAGTLYGLLTARVAKKPKARAFRQFDRATGKWVDVSWAEALARTDRFAAALAAENLYPGDRVAILLQNCVDWICFDMAAHKIGVSVVPLYTNDAVPNTAFLISDSRPRVVFVDTEKRWQEISAQLGESEFLDRIWVQSTPDDRIEGADRRITALEDVLAAAEGIETEAHSDPDLPAVLIYTSGTTGNPKGVILTHRAMLENAEAVSKVVWPIERDVFLSILPLAHAFERTMGYLLAIMGGACVAYAQSLLRLRQDLSTIRPTVIMGVPRLYESIHASARRAAAESPLRLRLFDMTARVGWERFAARHGYGPKPGLIDRMIWPVLDRFVAAKVRDAFGGRMRVAVSGGANFPAETGQALLGLGIPMVEGYGLTEAAPVLTASSLSGYMPGSVGFALPGIETRLTERGELLVHTPARMLGYWHRADATAEMLDDDGWLHTGDLAEIRDGRIFISGRLKHLLVLSNGENVNPRPIETAIEADPLVEQVCAVGDGRPHITALVVLNKETWADLASEHGLDPDDPNAPEAAGLILKRVKGQLGDFPAYQQVRACRAFLDEWTIERKLITPTLKLRRERVIAEFKDEIRELYAPVGNGF